MSTQEAKKFVLGLCPSARIDVLTAVLSGRITEQTQDVPNYNTEGAE